MKETKKGIVETILTHPFAFAFVVHSILQIVECVRTGKVSPFINMNLSVNSKEPDTEK